MLHLCANYMEAEDAAQVDSSVACHTEMETIYKNAKVIC